MRSVECALKGRQQHVEDNTDQFFCTHYCFRVIANGLAVQQLHQIR